MLIKGTVESHPDKPATKVKKESILALELQELVLSSSSLLQILMRTFV